MAPPVAPVATIPPTPPSVAPFAPVQVDSSPVSVPVYTPPSVYIPAIVPTHPLSILTNPPNPFNRYVNLPPNYNVKPIIVGPNKLDVNSQPAPPKKLISPTLLGPQKKLNQLIALNANPRLPIPPPKFFTPLYVENLKILKDEIPDVEQHTTTPALPHHARGRVIENVVEFPSKSENALEFPSKFRFASNRDQSELQEQGQSESELQEQGQSESESESES